MLISVLIVGAVGVSVAVSVVLLGLGSSRSSFIATQSARAGELADSCMEEALEQIREDDGYAGIDTVAFSEGTCTYEVFDDGEENRRIFTVGTVGTVIRRAAAEISAINPDIIVTSWRDVVE